MKRVENVTYRKQEPITWFLEPTARSTVNYKQLLNVDEWVSL